MNKQQLKQLIRETISEEQNNNLNEVDIGDAIIMGGVGGAAAFFGILAVGAGWKYASEFAAKVVSNITDKIQAEKAAAATAAISTAFR